MRAVVVAAVTAVAVASVAAPALARSPWDPLAMNGSQRVTMHITKGDVVTDGNIAVVPAVPVRLTVINATRDFHSFTIPQLHVNAVVMPGSPSHPRATTITFTAPQVGAYRWHCDFCPAVHHAGGMSGMLYALTTG
jgi:heme/copper-type cytochrome/quinol oxidase subunit 2